MYSILTLYVYYFDLHIVLWIISILYTIFLLRDSTRPCLRYASVQVYVTSL